MKQIFMLQVSILLITVAAAQENNPYTRRGEEYVTSINILAEDFRHATMSDITEESIKSYSSKLPLRNEASLELAAGIIRTVKSPGFDGIKFIDNSAMPDLLKTITKKILYYASKLNPKEFKATMIELAGEMTRAAVADNYKEIILTLIAIAYNSDHVSENLGRVNNSNGCIVSGPDGSGIAYGTACVLLGAITGAWIGFELCGMWCMLGGAIVGGIIGGLS